MEIPEATEIKNIQIELVLFLPSHKLEVNGDFKANDNVGSIELKDGKLSVTTDK